MARDDLDIPIHAHAGAGIGSGSGAGQSGGQGSSWRMSSTRSVVDPATKRLLLIAGGVGGALVLLVGAYSLSARHPAGIPVIEADKRPLRERPANPGGLEIAGADDAILGGLPGKDGMAPPPEAPAPAALLAQERAVQAAAAAKAAVPPGVPPQSAVPSAAAASSPAATPPVAASAPAAQPAVVLPAAAPPAVAPVTAAAAPHPAAAAPRPPAVAASAAGIGGMQVQLAALPSEEAAMTEWQRLSRKMPDMLGARHPAVSRIERDGKTYFRLRTGGFTDVAQATAFCQRIREKGTGCTIASF